MSVLDPKREESTFESAEFKSTMEDAPEKIEEAVIDVIDPVENEAGPDVTAFELKVWVVREDADEAGSDATDTDNRLETVPDASDVTESKEEEPDPKTTEVDDETEVAPDVIEAKEGLENVNGETRIEFDAEPEFWVAGYETREDNGVVEIKLEAAEVTMPEMSELETRVEERPSELSKDTVENPETIGLDSAEEYAGLDPEFESVSEVD